jgi:2-polyprenyl-3-methyl-5-hydroxy-6-metoxy-1,4-benzoquinol methylase
LDEQGVDTRPSVGSARCEVCLSTSIKHLRRSSARRFDVGRCTDCGLAFLLAPPPAHVIAELYDDRRDCTEYAANRRDIDPRQVDVLQKLRSIVGPGRQVLFDVGAGTGEFLVQAAQSGFEAQGSEIAANAIAYTKEHHGISLSPLSLDELPAESVDIITMWCVLAHVGDPRAFLSDALRMLRPGGVLFLRTPRWCLLDSTGDALDAVTRGRMHQLADRRINAHHMHMYNVENMQRLLREVGFVSADVQAVCHFPMTTRAYFDSTRGASKLRVLMPAIDGLIVRDRFVRNTLMVYARRQAG